DDNDELTELTDYRSIVDELALSSIDIRLPREDGERVIRVKEATGSLRSGAINVSATGAGAKLTFEGQSDRSTLSSLEGDLRVTGDNFADLADLVGLAAPDTPPFDALLGVDIADGVWQFDFRPETRVGDSDIYGPLKVTLGGETPIINADLRSATLDADDLGIVFGIPIGVGGDETVGETQQAARDAYNQSSRLIPNVVIDFSRLDAVDGQVSFTAESVVDSVFDIRALKLEFEIEGRVVRAPLLLAEFEQGSLDAYATIDGTRSPAVTTSEGNLNSVSMTNLALDHYLRGTSNGRFKAEMTGDGFREAAATMTGEIAVWSTDADVLALAVEGAALDIGEALTVLGESADDRTYTKARCLAAVLDVDQGIGTFSPAVVDTDDSLVIVRGDVNLANERLKLSVRSEAKDASLGTLIGDVGIGGTLRNPELLPFSGATVAQFGIAAILGSLSGGLAALPFIEPGGAEDAPCGALLARAEAAADNPRASN
ncbi:MAG: AsmA-like C-terminal region-containing protein, partial [Henriciella sp.]